MAVCDSGYDSISISSAKSFWEGNASEALPGHPGMLAGRLWDSTLVAGKCFLPLLIRSILADLVKVSDTANR